MFAIERLADVPQRLSQVYQHRLQAEKLPPGDHTLRGPNWMCLRHHRGVGGSGIPNGPVDSRRDWGRAASPLSRTAPETPTS